MITETKICYGCMNHISDKGVCSCGWHYDYSKEEQETLLAPGTILNHGNYMVGKRIGQGGFGVTYLGEQKNELGLKVCIKEYYPKKFAYRNTGYSNGLVPLVRTGMTQSDQKRVIDRYESGKRGFIEEAKRLVGFNELPSIVKVLGYFEENNTAYIVMEYINGIDLYHFMRDMNRTMSLPEIHKYIGPIMEDLHKVHQAGVIHRDISPDNIMVSQSGVVKLIDFGASVSQDSEDIKVQKKNGFAPLEQYETNNSQLGPWTDVYALCATIYYLLSGKMLPDARDRQFFDKYQTLQSLGIMVPSKLDKILKKGLANDFNKRYQSVRELAQQLKRVRDRRVIYSWINAIIGLLIGIVLLVVGYQGVLQGNVRVTDNPLQVSAGMFANEVNTETSSVVSASDYAVYDDLVYIRYIFDDGTIMLARSPIGTDQFSQVEYVTDGAFEEFCVYEDYLYIVMQKDRCLYRTDISKIKDMQDEQQQLSYLEENNLWQQVTFEAIHPEFDFYIVNGYVYCVCQNEQGKLELLRSAVDGSTQEVTKENLNITNWAMEDEFIYLTLSEGSQTELIRVRVDGCYYQSLGKYEGSIPAMVIDGEFIYYLFNSDGSGDSYLGRIGLEGTDDTKLVTNGNHNLEYCYMTGMVDGENIYYTCSVQGTEMTSNLYCYSLKSGSNKQISSECGRYIATSDDIDYIIFATMDGSEIRQMNKDGSNPKVMKDEDGSVGILYGVDVTSLEIIQDHVYYLDGSNVAYKKIVKEEW